MATKVGFVSLGCAKNLVNSEQMLYLTEQAGYEITGEIEGTDVVVLNTCGFIDSAKSEAIDQILQLAALKAEGKIKKIVVAGCLSERYKQEIINEMPEVDGLIGCGSYHEVARAVEEVLKGETPCLFGDIDAPVDETPRVLTTPWYTAFLRIAEGCDNRCSYCIIPFLRGKYRSRTMESVLAEANELAGKGVKELIVIAQDITRFGTDNYGRHMLAELLSQLCRIEGLRWIRLHYLYPDELNDELIEVVAREDKIVKYLDIPIQHINNQVLKRMNRRGTKEEIIALFTKLRRKIPGLVLRTSIICGLPGEGADEFEELCAFLKEARIERAGIFPFSPEEGTAAATMDDRADEDTTAHRVELLVDLQSRIMDRFNAKMQDTVLTVLCEGFDNEVGCLRGRSYADSPDVDGCVYFTAGRQVAAGEMVQVRISGTTEGFLSGEMEE